MPTKAVHSYTTVIKRGDGASPEVFTKIAELLGFGESPVAEPGKLEVTNSDSEDMTKEYIGDWKEPPEISCEANWDDTDTVQADMMADSQTNPPTVHNYQKCYSNGKVRQFPAYPVVKESADLKGQLKLQIKLVVTGASTLT